MWAWQQGKCQGSGLVGWKRGVDRYFEEPPRPFFKERYQVASRPHICKDCGEPIEEGELYRVTVWKPGRWFQWKKSHEVCMKYGGVAKLVNAAG